MKLVCLIVTPLLLISGLHTTISAQLQTPACVHGGGIPLLLDLYLANLGACNCQRSGVILNEFPKCDDGPFVIDFEDNFDGATIDTSKWQLPGFQGALPGGQNVGVYTWNNVSLSDGFCHLTAKKETITTRATNWYDDNYILADGQPNLRTFNFTSGLISTNRQFLYGKYEIRCRMPKGKGFWPAFWVFGGKRWNEIDFFDSYAGLNEYVSSLGHDFNGTGGPNGCHDSRKGFDFSDWHIFSCVFDYDKIEFLIDDKTVREINRVITSDGKPVLCGDNIDYGVYYQLEAYPIETMNIIVNLALLSKNGPADSMPIDDSTPYPSSFDIDYVRYSKRVPEALTIYPNPTPGKISIHSNVAMQSAELFNMAGQSIYKLAVSATDFDMNLSAEHNGIYLLKVSLDGIVKTSKIIKLDP